MNNLRKNLFINRKKNLKKNLKKTKNPPKKPRIIAHRKEGFCVKMNPDPGST